MNLFQISTWTSRLRPCPPATIVRNTFRDVAVCFEFEAVQGLPVVRRIVALHLDRLMLFPKPDQPGKLNAYDLMVLNLLLPTEAGIVVMSVRQQRSLKAYLRLQLYGLIRDRFSPLYDVPMERVYMDLLAVLHVVENYTSIKPIWNA